MKNFKEKETKILGGIKTLATAQGGYGRLYRRLIEARDSEDIQQETEYTQFIEKYANCKDTLDFVMAIEG